MTDLDDTAAWIRENRRAAFWRGVVMGSAVMLLLTTCVGCASFTPERAQKVAFAVIGGSIVATAIANGHGSKAPPATIGEVRKPTTPCHPQPDWSCR